MRLIDFFDRGCERAPQRACFTELTRSVTYREAQCLSHQFAAALAGLGIGAGSRAAILGPNSIETCTAILGLLRGGVTWVPLNHRNAVAETADILEITDCHCLLYSRCYVDQLPEIRRRVPSLSCFVCIDDTPVGEQSMAELMSAIPRDIEVDAPWDPSAVSRMPTTGGTTGRPKAAVRTHLSDATLVASFLCVTNFDEPPIYLLAAPVSHAAGGMAFPYLAVGGTVLLMDRPDPPQLIRIIEEQKVNALFLPPTAIYAMLAQPDVRRHDYRSLRYFYYGAAPMSVDKLIEAIDVFGPVMAQLFGQTEAPIIATYLSPQEHAEALGDPEKRSRLRSVGRAGPLAQVAVMDDDGRQLAPGTTGEIVIRSNLAIREYFRNPAETERLFRSGWVRTGDVGYKDADGYIYLIDRKKELIITGGFNVYPSEVEQVLLGHPAVQDCAVVGTPDPKWGEAVTAVVELKPGESLDPTELLGWSRQRLSGVKSPKRIEIWNELPRSPAGKVLRRIVRDRYWIDQDRRI